MVVNALRVGLTSEFKGSRRLSAGIMGWAPRQTLCGCTLYGCSMPRFFLNMLSVSCSKTFSALAGIEISFKSVSF